MTTTTQGRVRLVYALARSYRNLMSGSPAQQELCWRYSQNKAVFALCDGSESPFAGQLAAQFLAGRLADWLWALPDDAQVQQDELKVRLAYQLNAWAPLAQEQFLTMPLPEAPDGGEDQEAARRAQGSEAMFVCARMDFAPGQEAQVLFAWAGEAYLRCYTAAGEQIQFDPVRNPANRWSSILGLRGSLSVARLGADFAIRRVLAFSADIGSVEPDLAGYTPRRVQSLMQECFLNRSADDLAFMDLQVQDETAEGAEEPVDGTGFQEALSTVRMRYLETSDHTGVFEWSFPTDAIYTVVEEQSDDGGIRPVYAGAGGHWIVPADRTGCRYRVCVFSPDGKSWSEWVEPVLLEEHGLDDAALETEPPQGPSGRIETEALTVPPEQQASGEIEPALSEIFSEEPASAAVHSLDDIGLPIWVEETQPPAPLEQETRSAQEVDWDTWQPRYYDNVPAPAETAPAVPAQAQPDQPEVTPDQEVAPAPALEIEPALQQEEASPVSVEAVPEAPAPVLDEGTQNPPPETETVPRAGWLNFRASKGEQPGEYLLEWEPASQVRDYEIKKHFAGHDRVHTVRGTRDMVKGLEPGRHYLRIRPIYPGPRQEWDEQNLVVIESPERIHQTPANLRLETNPDSTVTLTWTFTPGAFVDEFWVYDSTARTAVLLERVPASITRCIIQPASPDQRRKYTVRAVNWSGAGPESPPVVFEPRDVQPREGTLERVMGFFRKPSAAPAPVKTQTSAAQPVESRPEKEESVTCTTFYELCAEVTRYLKRRGIRMERIRLEQRVGEDNYIPVDSRRTTELVSLNFTKGPDHRLFIFGSKGEVVTAVITFDKTRWTMKVRFMLAQSKS